MAFRSIGTLASEMLMKIEGERAAVKVAQRIDGPTVRGGGSQVSPTLIVDAPTPSGSDEKARPEPGVRANGTTTSRGLKLVSSNDRRTVPHAARTGRSPSPTVRRSLMLVGGLDHAAKPSASA